MEIEKIVKKYYLKDKEISILDKASFTFEKGKLYAILGHSGVGKSTLLNILGLLDSIDSGNYIINDKNVNELNEEEKATIRLKTIGFVFQSFYLNPNLKAYENVMIPMFILKKKKKNEYKKSAIELLKKFNLGDRINHYPRELSGGEQQRVALARALANNPEIILADEPTGNLDSENEILIFDELKRISRDGKIVIVVSHNDIVKKYADVLLTITNKQIKIINK